MEYQNPEIREGINTSSIHPLADFSWLLAAAGLLIAAIFGLGYILAGWLLPYIPIEFENDLLAKHGIDKFITPASEPADIEIEQYLQELTDLLALDAALPAGLELKVHLNLSADKNAFAVPGGHIIVNKGILEAVKSENGLAMILGHEIGHVVHRDPLMAAGRGIVSLTALALLTGFSHSTVSDTIFSLSSESMLLSFNRRQERAADEFSLGLLNTHYGHHSGASEFFNHIQQIQGNRVQDSSLAEFFSTHPDMQERIIFLSEFELTEGQLSPLPDLLH